MNTFTVISALILFVLTAICFLLPYRAGNKSTAKAVGITLFVLIALTLIGNLEVLVIFIWPLVAIFQILFITYWLFKLFKKPRIGQAVVTVLTLAVILLIMSPWIADWTYSKKDVKEVLLFHKIVLQDDFEIVRNESGGVTDYYETFTIRLSNEDFNRIAEDIKKSPNYQGYFSDYLKVPRLEYNSNESIEFETDNFFDKEYFSNSKMENGTFHFYFQLDKQNKELSYTGSDE